jgi:hypothetical protein
VSSAFVAAMIAALCRYRKENFAGHPTETFSSEAVSDRGDGGVDR